MKLLSCRWFSNRQKQNGQAAHERMKESRSLAACPFSGGAHLPKFSKRRRVDKVPESFQGFRWKFEEVYLTRHARGAHAACGQLGPATVGLCDRLESCALLREMPGND